MISLIATFAFAQFDNYFENHTLRMDYIHSGNSGQEFYAFKQFKKEKYWGGSHKNLLETFEYGKYFVKVFDIESGNLIYSRGYGSLFHEWSTTDEAKKFSKAFEETVVVPFPKNKVVIKLYSRNKEMKFDEKFSIEFDPVKTAYLKKNDAEYPVVDIHISGSPDKKVDMVILPEGYTKEELGKFINDCHVLVNELFAYSPYDKHKNEFNVKAVWAPSEEEGSDNPRKNIEVNTVLNTSFNTLYSDRYCMTLAYHKVRDMAANAPYDQIYILVNTDKYGGGAIYNYYSVSVSGNLKSPKVFIHEFGHAFAGLADEYAYEDSFENMYAKGVEPWEPNITTLVDFDHKWKDMVKKDTPIPTPVTSEYNDVVGAFEGAGYLLKGVYRPKQDCLMRSFNGDEFCPVCTKAIEDMIKFYAE
ncbi:MAG TPA: peptidase M64 [Bacteroidetes bacterium]|nr:peptidase M64 [Bacteroidota bacterium]